MRRAFSFASATKSGVRAWREGAPRLARAFVIAVVVASIGFRGLQAQAPAGSSPRSAPTANGSRSSGCEERLTLASDTLFEFERADLSTEAELSLQVVGALLQQKAGNRPVVIEGHTDALGPDWYNDKLREKRAQVVRNWLVERGFLRPEQATVKAFGKRRPVAPNTKADGSDDPEGRKQNRRVEIVVQTCD